MSHVIKDTELAFIPSTRNEQILYTARLQTINNGGYNPLQILHAYGQTNLITNDFTKLVGQHNWMDLRFFEYVPVKSVDYAISNAQNIKGNGLNYFLANMDNGIFVSHRAQSPISPSEAYKMCIIELMNLKRNTIRSYTFPLNEYERPITDKYDLFSMATKIYQDLYLGFITRYNRINCER